jgi:hypothetical protein
MTYGICCRRIGGRTAETRRRAPGTAFVAALAASLAVLAIGGAGSLAPTGFALAQTAGTAGPVSRGNPACNRREVFLYDVVVNGSKSGTETVRDMDGKGRSFSFDYAYSAHYPRVPVTIEHNCSGDIRIDGPTDRDPHPGSAQFDHYHWSNSITRTIRIPIGGGRAFSIDGPRGVFEDKIVTCSFDVAIGGLRAQIELNGFIPGSPGGRAMLVVHSLVPADDNRIEALIGARHNAECDKDTPSHASVFDGLPYAPARDEEIAQFYNKPTEVAGVVLEPPLLNLPGIIGTRDGDSAEARKLARGESFSVASGPRTHEGADAQGRFSAATSVTVTFNAVAPRGADCRYPELSSGLFTRDPFGPETPGDIAPSCESCPGGTWQLKIPQVTFHPTERQEEADRWTLTRAMCSAFPDACAPTIIPQCAYTYESIWACTATGEIAKRTKTKITDGSCQPKG